MKPLTLISVLSALTVGLIVFAVGEECGHRRSLAAETIRSQKLLVAGVEMGWKLCDQGVSLESATNAADRLHQLVMSDQATPQAITELRKQVYAP